MKMLGPNSPPIFLGSSGIGEVAGQFPAQINSFDVYYLPEFLEAGAVIDIRWSPVYNSPVAYYRVYRSLAQSPDFNDVSELELLGEFPSDVFSYIHLTGTLSDFYGISTVDNLGNESAISSLKQASDYVPPLCRIEGTVISLQGARLVDVEVKARLVTTPQSASGHYSISSKDVVVLSGEDGKFSLPVAQGAKVILMIDNTRISDPILVPSVPIVAFDTLDIYEEYKLSDLP